MSAHIPVRNVQALEELEGIAVLIGQRSGVNAQIAVLQIKDAIAELIEAAKKLHIVTAGTSQDVDANERAALASALARVRGGGA